MQSAEPDKGQRSLAPWYLRPRRRKLCSPSTGARSREPSYFQLSFFAVVQSLSRVQLFATTWTAARQASLPLTISQSSPKFMSVESVMLSASWVWNKSNHTVWEWNATCLNFHIAQHNGNLTEGLWHHLWHHLCCSLTVSGEQSQRRASSASTTVCLSFPQAMSEGQSMA